MAATRFLLKSSRLLHLYLGVFTAPALLFFAITGALQTFSFHETTRGSSYKPPRIIAELSQFHKKQNFDVPTAKLQPPAASEKAGTSREPTPLAARPDLGHPPAAKKLFPMKLFFLVVAVGLLLSTLTGLFMSYKYTRNYIAVTVALIAGIIVPIILSIPLLHKS